MKNRTTIVHWILQTFYWALAATMVYLALPTLIDWWGITWIVVLGVILGLILLPIPIWYRLTRGKWPAIYLFVLGWVTGCFGTICISLVFLSYPIVYRLVEGAWPWSFLIVQGSVLVVGSVAELYEKRVYQKQHDREAHISDVV